MEKETLSNKRVCLKHVDGYREKCGVWVFREKDVRQFIKDLKEEAVDVTGNGVLFVRIDKIDKLAGPKLVEGS